MSGPKRQDVIQVEDAFYILATSDRVDDRTKVLKHGDTFAVFDRMGDIYAFGFGERGLYHEGTRFLSRLELELNDARPLLLSSMIKEDNTLLAVDLTNPDIVGDDGSVAVPRGTVHIVRAVFLWEGSFYERIRVGNFGLKPVAFRIGFRFAADFVDIFQVRGMARAIHGSVRPPRVGESAVTLCYEGLDKVVRGTTLTTQPAPAVLEADRLAFDVTLEPGASETLHLTVTCAVGDRGIAPVTYDDAIARVGAQLARGRSRVCSIYTANEQFNELMNRSAADLQMMVTDTPDGPYPYAGVPWYNTPFGRDGIITALEYLWVCPDVARGVLTYLGKRQADRVSAANDAEPGKILHEARAGEMAALGEIPFRRYYGGSDTTPLFVILAGEYFRRTADTDFLEQTWPHVERALDWIDCHGDRDGDGFVEYGRRTETGLVNQGWKDSADSVFHADGSLADGPIAMCEIQGYVFAARQAAADMAEARNDLHRATALRAKAQKLQKQFEDAFWSDELGMYVMALDGKKQQCRIKSSNAGHLLWCGIADEARARRTAEALMADDLHSGWGIRTVAASSSRYNPMSYHNGSVWPHDSALCGDGFARYGMRHLAAKVLGGLFDASLFLDLHRMPELFCGFSRRAGRGPTLYPVACAPQSWSAAAPFLLLQSLIGLELDAVEREVRFNQSYLPPFLESLIIRDLRMGDSVLDISLARNGEDVDVTILDKEGPARVIVLK